MSQDVIRRHKAKFVHLPMGALGGPTELLVSMIIVTAYRVRSIYCFRWLLLKHLDSSGREQCL